MPTVSPKGKICVMVLVPGTSRGAKGQLDQLEGRGYLDDRAGEWVQAQLRGIVSKRLGSVYRRGALAALGESEKSESTAVKRQAEEGWGGSPKKKPRYRG
jgi:hypothetical protein